MGSLCQSYSVGLFSPLGSFCQNRRASAKVGGRTLTGGFGLQNARAAPGLRIVNEAIDTREPRMAIFSPRFTGASFLRCRFSRRPLCSISVVYQGLQFSFSVESFAATYDVSTKGAL